MISTEFQSNILDGIAALQAALNDQRTSARAHAEAEHAYRQARAKAFTSLIADGTKRTVDHTQAIVDIECATPMLELRLAEARHESDGELVKSLRQQLSAMQSLLGTYRAEAEAIRYGQGSGA
jgi:hypothetical protein